MPKKDTKKTTSDARSVNLSHNNETKSLVIDLGDLTNHKNVLIKGKQLKEPISLFPSITTNDPLSNFSSSEGSYGANPSTILGAIDPPEVTTNVDDIGDQNSQTNSGIINHSQFNDGGFGDIGQQWSRVHLHDSTIINNHTSINLTLSGDNGTVNINGNSFGTGTTISGKKNEIKNHIKENRRTRY